MKSGVQKLKILLYRMVRLSANIYWHLEPRRHGSVWQMWCMDRQIDRQNGC